MIYVFLVSVLFASTLFPAEDTYFWIDSHSQKFRKICEKNVGRADEYRMLIKCDKFCHAKRFEVCKTQGENVAELLWDIHHAEGYSSAILSFAKRGEKHQSCRPHRSVVTAFIPEEESHQGRVVVTPPHKKDAYSLYFTVGPISFHGLSPLVQYGVRGNTNGVDLTWFIFDTDYGDIGHFMRITVNFDDLSKVGACWGIGRYDDLSSLSLLNTDRFCFNKCP